MEGVDSSEGAVGVLDSQPGEEKAPSVRKSSRERQPTAKMAEFEEEENKKKQNRFFKCQGVLKTMVKQARELIKTTTDREAIVRTQRELEQEEAELVKIFKEIRNQKAPSQRVREKMDQSTAMVQDVQNGLSELDGMLVGPVEAVDRKEITDGLLQHSYAKSVYGSTVSRGSVSSSSKKQRLEAELAAKEAEMKMNDEIAAQKEKLRGLEAKKELEGIKARIAVYQNSEADDGEIDDDSGSQGDEDQIQSNSELNEHPVQNAATDLLVQSLAECFQRSRLPVPVPQTFAGDPMQFVEFRRAFQTLIESRGLPASEKLYYLKQYLAGEAHRTVEGFFLGSDEMAYKEAWAALEDRYGHPFKIQQAFRHKLDSWNKIHPKDAAALQRFADFLKTCLDAMRYVKDLSVLNDCLENRKILNKLPEWIVVRWNRITTEAIEETGQYPTFKTFVEFVRKEARVVNNPISSLNALGSGTVSGTPEKPKTTHRSKTTTLATKTEPGNTKKENYTPKPCIMCSERHFLDKCPKLSQLTLTGRRSYIKENKLCFGCLKGGHGYKECRRPLRCSVCNRRHPTVLHEFRPEHPPEISEEKKDSESAVSCKVNLGESNNTSMIVPVWVSSRLSPASEVLTYALLDTQSDSSFILEDLAKSLSISSAPVCLKLSTMTSSSTIECNVISDLTVRGMAHHTEVEIKRCYTREFIPVDRGHIPTKATAEAWPHLQSIAPEMSAMQGCEVGLLIGYNCPQALAPRQVITGQGEEPFAIKTELGWSIVGSAPGTDGQPTSTGQCFRVTAREVPSITPREILQVLESDFAENHKADKTSSQEDLQFVKLVESNISQREDGHLEMPLPFKKRPQLPNNRKLALIRLHHLKKKMVASQNYKRHYVDFMNEVINRGFAEPVTKFTSEDANYIPHHGVYHPKKDKIRVVFDCSAKYAGTSLNDHLLKGPDLTNNLIGILCRFRQHEVALLCDIEKMFYQFKVSDTDRNFLRFLWWKDGDVDREPMEYRMTVHLFGAASSPGCANFGLKYLAERHQNTFPLASKFISRNFYVDDGVTSLPDQETAIQLAKEARSLCAQGGLRLHKFVSNDRKVLESVPISERAAEVQKLDLDFDALPLERALGISWNPTTDSFNFSVSLKDQPSTRRGILSTVASLYDPLGFVAPVVLNGKKILQEMCQRRMGWDEEILDALRPRWEQWKEELAQLEDLKIQRCYHPLDFGTVTVVELHHFSDACNSGYGQCSYLRLVNEEGVVHCSLVFAKARVSPTKIVTIPRLELSAAVVSVKVSTMLREELDYKNMREYFWTDSKVVLGYINNEARRFHTFVANRVELIRERTTPEQWSYVPTENNPADYASRGLSTAELITSSWFAGPEFLWQEKLPSDKNDDYRVQVGDPEVKAVVLSTTVQNTRPGLLARLRRLSNWSMMTAVTSRLKNLAKRRSESPTVEDRRKAENYILKLAQEEHFSEEIASLGKGKTVKKTSPVYSLNPFLDSNGLLRVGGRLRKSNLPSDIRSPVILPKRSEVTEAIVRHTHDKSHQGRGFTLNEVRANGYWIIGGSGVVAKLIKNCVACRRLRRPEEEQKMADLPDQRIEPSPPFTYVGMDCFGPFLVKRGRTEVKRYGLLFTCFCSRAVHIEMLDDLSTDAFINGLRCFVAIRGAVRQIRCDQGSNFVGANSEFKREIDTTKTKSFLADQQCEIDFNSPCSSHAGGVWERQIRTVRSVLRATINLCPGRLEDSSLRTFFYEAMAVVNSRPLTPLCLSDPTADPPLTPNQILTMKSKVAMPPPGQFVREDLYARKRWRRVQFLLEQFWSRWRKEYLMNLQQRVKWNTNRRNLKVGDIVLVSDHDTPRMKWPLGLITSVTTDDDGLVRKARVKLGTKELDKKGRPIHKVSELERPIQRLILLLESEP